MKSSNQINLKKIHYLHYDRYVCLKGDHELKLQKSLFFDTIEQSYHDYISSNELGTLKF